MKIKKKKKNKDHCSEMKEKWSLNLKLPKQAPLPKQYPTVGTAKVPTLTYDGESGYFLTETKAAIEPSTENCTGRAGTTSDSSKSTCSRMCRHKKDEHVPCGYREQEIASRQLTCRLVPARWNRFWWQGISRREHSRQEGLYNQYKEATLLPMACECWLNVLGFLRWHSGVQPWMLRNFSNTQFSFSSKGDDDSHLGGLLSGSDEIIWTKSLRPMLNNQHPSNRNCHCSHFILLLKTK